MEKIFERAFSISDGRIREDFEVFRVLDKQVAQELRGGEDGKEGVERRRVFGEQGVVEGTTADALQPRGEVGDGPVRVGAAGEDRAKRGQEPLEAGVGDVMPGKSLKKPCGLGGIVEAKRREVFGGQVVIGGEHEMPLWLLRRF